MRWIIPMFIISLFMFSFIMGSVLAWYETEEQNLNINRVYENVQFENDNIFANTIDYDVPDRPSAIYNLEPGYFLLSTISTGASYYLIKYSTDGTIVWLNAQIELSNGYAPYICIDEDYNIFTNDDEGVQFINGQNGEIEWTFDNINNYGKIGYMAYSDVRDLLFIYEYQTYKGYYLDVNSGTLSTANSITQQYLQSADWTHDGNLVVNCKDNLYLYDNEFDLLDSETIGASNIMTVVPITKDNSSLNYDSDIVFIGYVKTLATYEIDGNNIVLLWDEVNTTSYIYGNILYCEATGQITSMWSNGGSPSGSPGTYIVSFTMFSYDVNNYTWKWNSALFNNIYIESGFIMSDNAGTVIYQKQGAQYLYVLYPDTGNTRESQELDSDDAFKCIYDRNSDMILVPTSDGSSWDMVSFEFNSSYVAGGGHIIVLPDELDEETWDWILFTMLIVAISAIGAATAFNGFSQTGFLCFLNINIFIGCWYDIYPIELIVLPMAILAVVIFRTAGDVTE